MLNKHRVQSSFSNLHYKQVTKRFDKQNLTTEPDILEAINCTLHLEQVFCSETNKLGNFLYKHAKLFKCLNSELAALFACSLTGYLQCNTQVVLLEKCSRKDTMLSIKSSSIQPTINNLPYHVHSLLANCNKDTFGAITRCQIFVI